MTKFVAKACVISSEFSFNRKMLVQHKQVTLQGRDPLQSLKSMALSHINASMGFTELMVLQIFPKVKGTHRII
jgi:hypothetical protein